MSAPTDLDAADLAGAVEDGEHCPRCRDVPVSGVRSWDDRGPHQLIAVRTYRCEGGHEWQVATDGG